MIRKMTALAAAAGSGAVLLLPSIASAASVEVQQLTGQGAEACPKEALCLYQHTDFNQKEPGRIWVIKQAVKGLDPRPHGAEVAGSAVNTFSAPSLATLVRSSGFHEEIVGGRPGEWSNSVSNLALDSGETFTAVHLNICANREQPECKPTEPDGDWIDG